MDLFSLIIQAAKEAERLAADTRRSATDRQAATVLADTLKSLRGSAFKFRDAIPLPTDTSNQ